MVAPDEALATALEEERGVAAGRNGRRTRSTSSPSWWPSPSLCRGRVCDDHIPDRRVQVGGELAVMNRSAPQISARCWL